MIHLWVRRLGTGTGIVLAIVAVVMAWIRTS